MIDTLQELTEQYVAALEDYLSGAREEALQRAYELGRKAIAEGVGVLEMASVHNKSLAAVFANHPSLREILRLAGHASTFFAESLSPFEMVLRGYREANARLHDNLQQLEAAEQELQRQNRELAGAHQSAKEERQRYRELFDFAPDGYLVTDLEGSVQEVSSSAAHLLQIRKDLLPGQSLLCFVVEQDRDSFRKRLNTLQSGEITKVEDWQVAVRLPGENEIPVSLRVALVSDPQGNPVGLRWLMSDITERRRMEEERAQLLIREHVARAETEAAQRLTFLAEASTALVTSLDYGALPANIAHLPVPYLADCCFVHLIEDAAAVRQVAVAHSDPAMSSLASRLPLYWTTQGKAPAPIADVLRTTRPATVPEITDSWLESFAGGAEPLGILRELSLRSALLVPLLAEGRPLGTMTLARSGGIPYLTADGALAEELARRCSLALDNARLHHQVVVERDKAEKASQAKDEFVAILSHELRTPLTTILGWARVLKKQPVIQNDQTLGDGVKTLEHNARNIARLVEDCLDLARITERKIQLHKELADLNQVIKAALDATRETVGNKDLNLLIHLSPAKLWVFGDRARLEQVMVNLLSNAFKYTGERGVVSVSSLQIEQEAEITVQDTGVGIAPEFLDDIFRPFHQGTLHWLGSESGLGLGLTIARAIVQMHGGRLWAESAGQECGSTFRLRVPLAADEPAGVVDQEPAPLPVAYKVKPLRILFIEDSTDVLNLMKMELEELGYVVFTEADAVAGLRVAQRERPDVIVSDIKMPGLDGYEFIRRLRQMPEMAAVPAIALTGFGLKQDVEKAIAAGYNAHLCKPVEIEQLTALFNQLTRQ